MLQYSVKRLIAFQWGLIFVGAGIAGILCGRSTMFSVFVGGLICIIPCAWFARRTFRYHGAQAAKQIVQGFYKGQAQKMFLSAALFALAFKTHSIQSGPLFLGYILVQMSFWLAPWMIVNNRLRLLTK